MRKFTITLVASLSGIPFASAEEPEPTEKLPPPRLVAPAPGGNLFLNPAPPILYQHGTRDVWQSYSVDSYGRWRPRVVFSPYGSYYYGNGQPYPWTTTNPRSFRPVTTD